MDLSEISQSAKNGALAFAQPRDLSLPMKVVARSRPDYSRAKPKLMVCVNVRAPGEGNSCGPRGGKAIHEALLATLDPAEFDGCIVAVQCLGTCNRGPTLRLIPNNSWFYGAHLEDVPVLVSHLEAALAECATLPLKCPDKEER